MHERTLSAVVPLLLALGPSAAAADRALTFVESQLLAVPNGERLHITRAGSGKPVVLIPGLFGSAFGFRKVTARLPPGDWQVVVIEPLGVGDSDRPSEADYSLVAQADRVAAAITAFRRMGEAREMEPLAPHLSAIRCPVRLLLGAAPHEGGPGVEEVQLLRDRIAFLEIVRVPQAGNFVFEEAPGAVVDAIVQVENGS